MLRETIVLHRFRGPWGVPVRIGASLLLLPVLMIDFTAPGRYLLFDAAFVAILIGSILLHELGHAWGALIQGVGLRHVTLHGGGGDCATDRVATCRERELIAAMGPIVNLALWAAAGLAAPGVEDPEIRWAVQTLGWVNGFLAVFNLLPVFPLDGGKLLHLVLCRVLPEEAATRIGGGVGLVVALLWYPWMAHNYLSIGVILLFLPSIPMHFRMLRAAPP